MGGKEGSHLTNIEGLIASPRRWWCIDSIDLLDAQTSRTLALVAVNSTWVRVAAPRRSKKTWEARGRGVVGTTKYLEVACNFKTTYLSRTWGRATGWRRRECLGVP